VWSPVRVLAAAGWRHAPVNIQDVRPVFHTGYGKGKTENNLRTARNDFEKAKQRVDAGDCLFDARGFLKRKVDVDLVEAHATGLTAKGIKAAKLKPLPLPIAPLAEQRRIVTKVDELMGLCDQLEKSLASADEHQRQLLEATLHGALNSDEVEELVV